MGKYDHSYENYEAFHALWKNDQEITASKISKMKTGVPSLAKFLGQEGFPIKAAEGSTTDISEFKKNLHQEFFRIKNSLQSQMEKGKVDTETLRNDITKFREFLSGYLEYSKAKAVFDNFGEIQSILQSQNFSQTNFKRIKDLLGYSVTPTVTLIGDIAEQQMRQGLQSGPVHQQMKQFAMGTVFKAIKPSPSTAGGIRNNIYYTATLKNSPDEHTEFNVKHGEPLVDIHLKVHDKNGEPQADYKISVKEVVAKKEKGHQLRALTRSFGVFMAQIGHKDTYYWWTFMRLFSQTNSYYKAVQEAKGYVATKNMQQALLGGDDDKIGDFIINGKLYSADYFLEQLSLELRSGIMAANSVLSLDASLKQPEAPTLKPDDAVQEYIKSKFAEGVLNTKAILKVGIPTTLLK